MEAAIGGPERFARVFADPPNLPELHEVAGARVWSSDVPSSLLSTLLNEVGTIGTAEREMLMHLSMCERLSVGLAVTGWGDELLDLLESKGLIVIDDDVRPVIPALGLGFRQQLSTLGRAELLRRSDTRLQADPERLDSVDLLEFLALMVKANGLEWLAEECSSSRPSGLFPEAIRLFALGCCQILFGDTVEATDTLRDATVLALPQMSSVCTSWLAAAISMGGDHELGSIVAATSSPVQDPRLELLRQQGLGWTRAAQGDNVSAAQTAMAVAHDARDLSVAAAEAWALLDAARFGRADQSVFRATMLARSDEPLVALLASGAVAIRSNDVEVLDRSARTFDEHGFTLWASEFRILSSEVRRKSGLPPLFSPATMTAHTPILRRTRFPGLTRREIEIASMASRYTSAQVAEVLVISVRTVDNLLGRVYRKLGISGRQDLVDIFV